MLGHQVSTYLVLVASAMQFSKVAAPIHAPNGGIQGLWLLCILTLNCPSLQFW